MQIGANHLLANVKEATLPYVTEADRLKKEGYREAAAWMARAEKVWK